jgi:hypothetical protein
MLHKQSNRHTQGDCSTVVSFSVTESLHFFQFRSTGRGTCPSATLPTTNLTWNDLGSNPCFHGERPATNSLRNSAPLKTKIHLNYIRKALRSWFFSCVTRLQSPLFLPREKKYQLHKSRRFITAFTTARHLSLS